MGFIAHTHDDGQIKPFEWLPVAGSIAIQCGTALATADGLLILATGPTKPTYIAETDIAATTAGEHVPVTRVDGDLIYETQLSVASADIAVGAKYTIDATGGKITATATAGVAEVTSFDGTAAGSYVRVRF